MDPIEEDEFNEEEFFTPAPKVATALPLTPENPLTKYFRAPGLHVRLPTKGAFLPKEYYSPTLAGEIPVYPMRAQDELLLKSPDALMSGFALEKLLESCVPSIPEPRLISTPDLDVLLLAIRAASYGDRMDIDAICPKCQSENTFSCHLPSMMGNITFVDAENAVRLSDEVVVYLRPFNLANATKIALETYNEARHLQNLQSEDNMVEQAQLNKSYEKINRLNVLTMADAVLKIVIPTGEVTDKSNIHDFMLNTSSAWVNKIETKLKELNEAGVDKNLDVKCQSCDHEWQANVEFDPSSFFATGS